MVYTRGVLPGPCQCGRGCTTVHIWMEERQVLFQFLPPHGCRHRPIQPGSPQTDKAVLWLLICCCGFSCMASRSRWWPDRLQSANSESAEEVRQELYSISQPQWTLGQITRSLLRRPATYILAQEMAIVQLMREGSSTHHFSGEISYQHIHNIYTVTYQDHISGGDGDEEIGSHKEDSPPDVPHSIPAIAPPALQTTSQGIRSLYMFLKQKAMINQHLDCFNLCILYIFFTMT